MIHAARFLAMLAMIVAGYLWLAPGKGQTAEILIAFEERAEASGCRNTHSMVKLAAVFENIMPWLSSVGAAAAAADFDNDGFADLYMTNSGRGDSNRLFQNQGDGTFKDVTGTAGVECGNPEGASMHAIWGDVDNDGWKDLYVVKWAEANQFFRNNRNGTFTDITESAGVGYWGYANGATFLDYDRDGRLDILVGNYFAEKVPHPDSGELVRNNLWDPVTTRVMHETFTHADNGGRNVLYHNVSTDGTIRFEDVTEKTGLTYTGWTLAVGAGDLNNDNWPDLYIANDFGPDEFYLNTGGTEDPPRFRPVVDPKGHPGVGNDWWKGMNVDMGDVNNDGYLDIYVTNILERSYKTDEGNMLWINCVDPACPGGRGFRNIGQASGTHDGGWGWGGKFADFNNDGLLDIYTVNGFATGDPDRNYWFAIQEMVTQTKNQTADAADWPVMGTRDLSGRERGRLFIQLPCDVRGSLDSSVPPYQGGTTGGLTRDPAFIEVAESSGITDVYNGRGIALADYDHDGDVDMYIANQGAPSCYYVNRRNDPGSSPAGHFLWLTLVGRPDLAMQVGERTFATTKDAVGARVSVCTSSGCQTREVQGGTGFASQSEHALHFGIPQPEMLRIAKIRWPDGREQELVGDALKAVLDRHVTLVEGRRRQNFEFFLISRSKAVTLSEPFGRGSILADARQTVSFISQFASAAPVSDRRERADRQTFHEGAICMREKHPSSNRRRIMYLGTIRSLCFRPVQTLSCVAVVGFFAAAAVAQRGGEPGRPAEPIRQARLERTAQPPKLIATAVAKPIDDAEASAQAAAAVTRYDSRSAPVTFPTQVNVDTGGAGLESAGDDYTTASGLPFRLDQFVFVGGVNNANGVLVFEFYDSSLNFVNNFAVQLPQAGPFVWTITINAPFEVPGAGHINMWSDDGTILANSSGFWHSASRVKTGSNTAASMVVNFNSGIDQLGRANSNILAFEMRGGNTQETIAEYVRINILGGSYGDRTLWITETALDQTHVARHIDPADPDIPFPYPATWFVMIDDVVKANWGHPCRWLFVNDNLTEHTTPLIKEFFPFVYANNGAGPELPFVCTDVPGAICPVDGTAAAARAEALAERLALGAADKNCLHAILISGGINAANNNERYRTNLRSMYQKLRACGYPAANICVYYADGSSLDLDNDDADGNDATGSDVTGEASLANISGANGKIQKKCKKLDPKRDVLFIYVSNHGTKDKGANMWGKDIYKPADFATDTKDCKVCRLFVVMDQCYSGQFTGVAGQAGHGNMAIYTAASSTEPSVCRQYMDYWEDIDAENTDINDMHGSVTTSMAGQQKSCSGGTKHCVACAVDGDCPGGTCDNDPTSTPQSAEGTAGNGDVSLCFCWDPDPHATWAELGTLSYVELGTGGENSGIPAGFFGPGSDPFTGHIDFAGSPLDVFRLGNTSTLVERWGDPIHSADPIGTIETIPVEIVGLSLTSISPITVTYDGETPELWDMHVGLSSIEPPHGELTAEKTHLNGGTFDATLYVQPKFTFTRIGDGFVRELDTGEQFLDVIEFSATDIPWVHDVNPDLGIITASGEFVPGVAETIPGNPASQTAVPTSMVDPPGPTQHAVCAPVPPDPHATATDAFSVVDFGPSNPIPADFFYLGSQLFSGPVPVAGVPIAPTLYGDASTLLQRSDVPIPASQPPFTSGQVEVEITALSLASRQPMIVNGTRGPEPWKLQVTLSQVPAPVGHLFAFKTHLNGGQFQVTFFVQPKFVFTNLNNPLEQKVLDTGLEERPGFTFTASSVPWVHRMNPALGIIAPSNGAFVPGVIEQFPGDIGSQQAVNMTALDDLGTTQHSVCGPYYIPVFSFSPEQLTAAPGDRIEIEVQVAHWSPHSLGSYQVKIDPSGYVSGSQGSLVPFAPGAMIDTNNEDYVFAGHPNIPVVDTSTTAYRYAATTTFGPGAEDDGTPHYGGTLVLDVSPTAAGTFTVGFNPDPLQTFMTDASFVPIPGVVAAPAMITVQAAAAAPDAVVANPAGKCAPSYFTDCNTAAPSCVGGNPCVPWGMNRYLSFSVPPTSVGSETALRVRLTSLHHPISPIPPGTPNFAAREGEYRYVNKVPGALNRCCNPVSSPTTCHPSATCTADGDCTGLGLNSNCKSNMCPDSAVFNTFFRCARLGCTAEYTDWATAFEGGDFYVYGDAVVTDSMYEVAHLAASCAGTEASCADASAEITIRTPRWGNVDNSGGGPSVPAALDIGRVVSKVANAIGSFIEPRCQLREATPNPLGAAVNAQDIGRVVDAVKFFPYPFPISPCL